MIDVHGISGDLLEDAPTIAEVTQEVKRMVDLYFQETGE